MKIIDFDHDEGSEENKPLLEQDSYKSLRIMVCTPCFGGKIDQATVSGMMSSIVLSKELGIHVDFRFLSNESLITRARNNLVAQFLATDHTHLFFLDADIQFNPRSLLRLCVSDRMVTAGAYPIKGYPPRYVIDFKDGAMIDEQKFVEVNHAGTGFLCIKRECLEKMKLSYPELRYKSELETKGYSDNAENALSAEVIELMKDNSYTFFDTSIHEESKTYLSEDYTFCERWQKIGGKIWLDTASKLDHIGAATYGLTEDQFMSNFDDKRKEEPAQSSKGEESPSSHEAIDEEGAVSDSDQ
jgi:hypothetical protein